LDKVEHSPDDRNHQYAPHTATEMNFGLREQQSEHRLSSGTPPLVRAKALPQRVKAPAGLACPSLLPMPEGAGLIQPAGLA
jgi:hypothetical protein